MRYGSDQVGFVLLGGRDILGTLTDLDHDRMAVLEETTVLGVADESHAKVGVNRGSLKQRGFYDDAADSVNDALVTLAQSVMTIGLEGNTLGKQFTGWAGAIVAQYRRIASGAALHKADGDYQVTGKVEDGTILHTHKTETADPFTETSDDNAASSANGGAGYLQVSALALGGFTNIVVKIRDSTDDIAFADLITFTAVTAAPAAERKTVAGTINRYTRVEHDFTGAGGGQSVKYMAGLVRD